MRIKRALSEGAIPRNEAGAALSVVGGRASVTDLENILALRQPELSQQLARLTLDGLVSTRRDGKIIYYSIANEDIRRAIMLVYEVFV